MKTLFNLIARLFGQAPPTESEQREALRQRLERALQDYQISLAKTEQEYRAAEDLAQRLTQRLETTKRDPQLTAGRLSQEQFRVDTAVRKVDELFRLWNELKDLVSQYQTVLEGLQRGVAPNLVLTPERVDKIYVDLKLKEQKLSELSGAVTGLNDELTQGQASGVSMQKVNPPVSTQESHAPLTEPRPQTNPAAAPPRRLEDSP